MRNSILSITVLGVLVVACCATDCVSATAGQSTYGFSSEDWGGSSSYLGVDTRDVTPDRLSALHLKEEKGVEVTMVDQDAPAGKSGLKEQDVILTLNGENIESVEQLRRMIRETPPGRVVSLGVSRNGQPLTIKVQLADRKRAYAYSFPDSKEFHFTMPAIPPIPDIDVPVSIVVAHSSARSGLMVENITPQLGEFFGAKGGSGVLVRSVEKGSLADKAGLRAGDVIIKINNETVHDTGDFTHALRSRKESTASVGILRDKKEQTLTLTLPSRQQSELDRESLELPEINAETQAELSNLQAELADIGPQMREAINREMVKIKPQIEMQKKEMAKQQETIERQVRDAKRQMEEAKRQIRDHKREIERELREELGGSDPRI